MTTISISSFIEKVRLAIDERMHVTDDDFYKDLNAEIRQALEMVIRQLAMELPNSMLIPKVMTAVMTDLTPAQRKFVDGTGWVVLPNDYLKLIEFRLKTWMQSAFFPIDPASDEAKRQASLWGRGTPQKPRVMESYDSEGNHVLKYWTAGRYTDYVGGIADVYDHTIQTFNYVPMVELSKAYSLTTDGEKDLLDIPFKDEALNFLIFRTAAIVLTGKKESSLAQQFWQMSQAMQPQAEVTE